jgi:drug/metabolite transporter (DMT)-like permease
VSPRLGALLAVVFWGVSFVATKAVVARISPFTLVFARTVLGAALVMALLAGRGGAWWPPRRAWPTLALMGFVGVALHQVVQAAGLALTSAVSAGWLIGLTPIWSALFAAVHLGERLGASRVAGLLLGFLGAAVLVTRGRPLAEVWALPSTTGDLLMLASTVNWAVYSVIGHPMLKALGALRATAGAMLAGLLVLAVPFAARAGWRDLAGLDAAGWAALLFLGIACSGLGYYFWYGALERIEASRVAAFLYVEPLVTLAAAVVLLGEPVGISTVAGGVLVMAGVALVQR